MKKINFTISSAIAFIFITLILLSSCNRDKPGKKLYFTVKLKTWYRVSPTSPDPVVVNGTSYISLANLVVAGEGTATHMGKIKDYANTLSYSSSPEGPPLGAIGASVTDIPGYRLTGGPLPLIQPGDFAGLPSTIAALNIPGNMNGKIINVVLYNDQGDAVFISNIPGTGTSTIISPIIGGYSNKSVIAGGAGKYKYASGELSNHGHFSFIEPFDGEDNYEGWISF
jgi:hypothetical protein